jgi:hypothetical protein
MAEITDLLLVQQKLRDCVAKTELGYVIVNDSEKIVEYQSSILWVNEGTSGKVQSVSGLPEPIKHIPFTVFIQDICRDFHKALIENPVTPIDVSSLSEQKQQQWREFLPEQAVWVRLQCSGNSIGGVLLARKSTFQQEEIGLLAYWGGAVGHAVNALWFKEAVKPSIWARLRARKVLWIIAGLVFLICWIPVSLSVNASGEVVPKEPLVERSPIDGIVGEVFVQPNQLVSSGDLVMTFDDTAIRAELDVVKQELAIAQAEYQRANQAAVFDRDTSSQLPMLQARVEQQEAQVSYSEGVLERSRVYAERDGIIIIQIESELEGRPVQVGEKLFTLAEAGRSELEFWLAVGDSIPLPSEAEVRLFLNVHPDRSYDATIRFVSYQAEVSPDGILGYRGRADLINGTDLLVGWRGTAKIYGESVPLIYLILRRPLAVLRQWLGL